ncbi:MAG: hypothetical protein AAGM38_03375 [Pseudomonadota bacterium]
MSETTLYYIAMVAIYSGLLPWIAGQLTKSRADERNAARGTISETLALVERLRAAQAAAEDPARRASYDVMIKRLLAEANDEISELNANAALQSRRPAQRYMIIPTPRSGFGVILTMIFVASVYFALLLLLTTAFDFWNDPTFDVLNDPGDRQRTFFLGGAAIGLGLLAFLARWLAYRSYDRTVTRLREEAAQDALKGA